MLSYRDIYEVNIDLWNFLKKNYNSDKKMWDLFFEFYIDPDGYPIEDNVFRRVNDIPCTADGLLSIKRIKCFEGVGDGFIETYKKYRKTPIFFFPSEKNGINVLRARLLEDRIDHTLLDLKNCCERKGGCILESAYQLPKTKKWLKHFNYEFGKIAEWLGIIKIFVKEDTLEIYDLEKSDDSVLSELKGKDDYIAPRNPNYISAWSKEYYENVKKKIILYEKMLNNSNLK